MPSPKGVRHFAIKVVEPRVEVRELRRMLLKKARVLILLGADLTQQVQNKIVGLFRHAPSYSAAISAGSECGFAA